MAVISTQMRDEFLLRVNDGLKLRVDQSKLAEKQWLYTLVDQLIKTIAEKQRFEVIHDDISQALMLHSRKINELEKEDLGIYQEITKLNFFMDRLSLSPEQQFKNNALTSIQKSLRQATLMPPSSQIEPKEKLDLETFKKWAVPPGAKKKEKESKPTMSITIPEQNPTVVEPKKNTESPKKKVTFAKTIKDRTSDRTSNKRKKRKVEPNVPQQEKNARVNEQITTATTNGVAIPHLNTKETQTIEIPQPSPIAKISILTQCPSSRNLEQKENQDMLSAMRKAISEATEHYVNWSTTLHGDDTVRMEELDQQILYRGPKGNYSKFNHNKIGREHAEKFLDETKNLCQEELIKAIGKFLIKFIRNYNRHSYSSFLLDELRKQVPMGPGSFWNKLNEPKPIDNGTNGKAAKAGLYKKSEVRAAFEKMQKSELKAGIPRGPEPRVN